MKKNHKRYHKTLGGKVASVYVNEVYSNGNNKMSFVGRHLWAGHYADFQGKYVDSLSMGRNIIQTHYYEYIGVCVSNSRRFNNDWWNGDKRGDIVYNKSTGNIRTIVAIVDMLEQHVLKFVNIYGYYVCMFDPTDEHRENVYRRMMHKMAVKNDLKYRAIKNDEDGSYIYVVASTVGAIFDYYS